MLAAFVSSESASRKLPIEEARVWSSIGGEPWLHAEKRGYGVADLHLQAGDEPATLRLKR